MRELCGGGDLRCAGRAAALTYDALAVQRRRHYDVMCEAGSGRGLDWVGRCSRGGPREAGREG